MLPTELSQLAWLDLTIEAGQEHWEAMELMGRYAAANHEVIHRSMARALGVEVMLDIENHHNFAWRERHRRDRASSRARWARRATSCEGRGVASSLNSASHGAGRRMSRTRAKELFDWDEANALRARAGNATHLDGGASTNCRRRTRTSTR